MIPNIFISSTIADLQHLRDAIRETILELGYRPIMSDHGDIGYLPTESAEDSCYGTMSECQIAVLIIGKRYGSKSQNDLSITHNEFRKAKDQGIPTISIIDQEVLSFQRVYDANVENETKPSFPGMDSPEDTFSFIKEIMNYPTNNGILPYDTATKAKQQLKRQIAQFFGSLLTGRFSPMWSDIKDVLAEIGTLRHELSETRKLDPDFLTTLRFIIDDSHNHGLRYLIEQTIGPIDKAIPFLIKSRTFDEFIKNIGWNVKIKNDLDTMKRPGLDKESDLMGMMQFGVLAPKEESGFGTAWLGTCKDKTVLMNNYAKRHFDWMIEELNKHTGTKQAAK